MEEEKKAIRKVVEPLKAIKRENEGIWKWYSVILLTYLKTSILMYYLFQFLWGKVDLKIVDLALLVVYLLLLVVSCICHTIVFFKRSDIVYFFNQFITLQKEIERKSESAFRGVWKKVEYLAKSLAVVIANNMTIKFVTEIIHPNKIFNLFYVIPRGYKNDFWAVMFGVVDIYISVAFLTLGALLLYICMIYVLSTLKGLELLSHRRNSYSVSVYRRYRLVNVLFNKITAHALAPTTVILLGLSWIAFGYLMIRTHDQVALKSIVLFVFAFVAIGTICSLYTLLFSSLHTASEYVLELWRRQTLSLCSRRIIKSLMPLGAKVGEFYIMKKSTPATYFKIVFDGMIHALLGQ